MPRPKTRTPELREHVVRTAVALIASDGVDRFTTRRVAAGASTSTPAVYELFGDRGGLVREVFFEGFRILGRELRGIAPTDRPRADLVEMIAAFRRFHVEHAGMARVMFARPFPDFDPSGDEAAAGRAVREHVVARVRRAIDAGDIAGDATDIAHVLLALAQGMASVEVAGWLGTSAASVERRWALAVDAVLEGLRPSDPGPGPRVGAAVAAHRRGPERLPVTARFGRMARITILQNSKDAVEYKAGQVIFSQGDPAEEMYVVVEGTVDIVISGQQVGMAGPGEAFGEMALLEDAPRSATAVARVDSPRCRSTSAASSSWSRRHPTSRSS